MSLGARLRELRLRKAESLQQVADAVAASKPHIWELETGRSSNPSIELLKKLADHFGVTVGYLVGEETVDAEVLAFWREFKGLSEDDRQFLRDMAERLSKKSGGAE